MRRFEKVRHGLQPAKFGKNPTKPIRPWPYNGPLDYRSNGGGGGEGGPRPEQGEPQNPDDSEQEEFELDEDADQKADLEPQESEEDDDENSEDEPEEAEEEFTLDELPTRQFSIPFYRTENDTVVREFPSWYDFVTCANDASLQSWMNKSIECGSRCKSALSNTYYATNSFDQAVDMAIRSGWPEGRDLMYECLQAVRPKSSIFKSETYEVAGPIPIVSIYVTGDPACMQDWQHDHLANNKIVSIEVSIYCHVGIKAQTVMQRGAAILSLCHSLEQQGYSVEILASGYAKSIGASLDFYSSIAFKPAGEPIDIDRAAFALAHPSAQRRLMFAIIEQSPELRSGFYYGMGYPQQKQFIKKENTIYIPAATTNETLEQSRVAVEAAAQTFLQREDLAA